MSETEILKKEVSLLRKDVKVLMKMVEYLAPASQPRQAAIWLKAADFMKKVQDAGGVMTPAQLRAYRQEHKTDPNRVKDTGTQFLYNITAYKSAGL